MFNYINYINKHMNIIYLIMVTIQVIGIDPGLRFTGWALLSVTQEIKITKFGLISTNAKESLINRIQFLYTNIRELTNFDFHSIALESGYCGICGQSALKLGMVRGAIISGCLSKNVYMYSPATIKQIVTGKGNAKKDVIFNKIKSWFPEINDDISYDETDAIAVALTHIKSFANISLL